MAKWGPLIKLSNLFKLSVIISSVWTCLLSVCFFETAVEILADLLDVDDAAGVTVLSILRFCPPTAGDFLQTFWFGEVCLLDDVIESNKLGKRFLIAVKSNKSRLAATGCAEWVRAILSLSNNSPFPLTSLAGETKYLKQVKIQRTLRRKNLV